MINFQKNDVENNALYLLKREFPNKYKNAFISDRPDIQCHEPSVGVEVVTCDFKEIVLNHTYKDISLLKLFKREKVKAIKCKDISYMFDNEFPNEYILEFLSKGIFVERDNEAIKIKNIIEFRNLYEDDILYMKDLLRIPLILSEDGNLCRVIPPAIWVGGLTDKLMTVFEKKEIKYEKYKLFKENNIYIQTFSGTKEEYIKFEKNLREKLNLRNTIINNIYITNFWNNNESMIYKIKL